MRLVLVLLTAMVAVEAARSGLNPRTKEQAGEAKEVGAEKEVEDMKEVKAENDVMVRRKRDEPKIRYTEVPSTTTTTPTTTTSATTYASTIFATHPPPHISNTRPADCADYLMEGYDKSGVYVIYPFTCSCNTGVKVWCDMETDGGGWTVLIKRQKQSYQLDFNRTWAEYKEGFGNPYKEYYIGNEKLHTMTHSRSYTIRLDVELASGGLNYATYETVRVEDEDNRYQMYLSGSSRGTSSATYCFNYMSGRYFTTIDRDYDSYSGNCAANQGGAWWYYNCRYFNPTNAGFNQTLDVTCYNSRMKVTSLQLKIRPKICDASYKTIHLRELGCGCQNPH